MGSWLSNLISRTIQACSTPSETTPVPYIIVAGLDAAGKTTFIDFLTSDYDYATIATIGFYEQRFVLPTSRKEVILFELGGSERIRQLWSEICDNQGFGDRRHVLGIFYVIDSTQDSDRYIESSNQLLQLITYSCLSGLPLCILNNKTDLRGFNNAAVSSTIMNTGSTIDKHRSFSIMDTCALTGLGLQNSISWMEDNIKIS